MLARKANADQYTPERYTRSAQEEAVLKSDTKKNDDNTFRAKSKHSRTCVRACVRASRSADNQRQHVERTRPLSLAATEHAKLYYLMCAVCCDGQIIPAAINVTSMSTRPLYIHKARSKSPEITANQMLKIPRMARPAH